ncbi:conserved hypothetical protein [Verrucomicrobia bacterium]|nr:conserved hypothetical protein [Verrucomicrobiota bacterium]
MSRSKSKLPESPGQAAGRPANGRIWRLRLAALVGVPALLLVLLETGLRLAGCGHPANFLLSSSSQGQKTWVQNNQFGWRFFGPQMSRLPSPTSIPQDKKPGTVRIFVFGESAAFGDPQPRFGLPRMLEALLELRHPGTKFEVVNAAMTGINSHVILPLARDCARARGDVWVIYMGNNEVVGPFGSGTVFGPQVPPLALIRASLALKATRTGQLLDGLREVGRSTPPSEWGGMLMFVNQKVRATDPRMAKVYGNFERNLTDIIRAGRESGAKVVVSTVAVNLRDCAPFASLHRADLSSLQQGQWEERFRAGAEAQAIGKWPEAQAQFRAAAQLDDTFGELRFRLGQCALALGEVSEAQTQLAAARDLDALRFRCDGRLNEIIRQAARDREGVLLADGERALGEKSPEGLPGSDAFYEHVHLTFEGNYILARAIAEKIDYLLPQGLGPTGRPWPELGDCARRLGRTDRAWELAVSEMLGRLTDPPFTFQLNYLDQQRRLAGLARKLGPPDSPAMLREAQRACQTALEGWPEDALLYQQLAELKQAAADSKGAATAARRSLELLPSNTECWLLFGLALAQERQYEEASAAFRRVFELDPQDVWGRQNLAICLEKMGHREEAMKEFKRALKIKPRFELGWLGLGQLYEQMGRKAEAALCFNEALTNRMHRASELTTLARFCLGRQWYEAACTNYADAIELSPNDPQLRLELGRSLAAVGRHAEAAKRFAEAIELSPDLGQAHFLRGAELGTLDRTAEAEGEFREAVRLMPEVVEARLNLGIALYKQGKMDEALKEFENVLSRSPNNALALKYTRALRERAK